MKETENSLSDQRLRNTINDLRNAETEIKSLSERSIKQHETNGNLQKKILSERPEEDHSTMTKKQQRRVLKGVAMILLCVSSLTAICAVVGCKMTNPKSIESEQQCDMRSNLGACRLGFGSQGVEVAGKRQPVKTLEVSHRKKRNFLASAISESTPSSVVEHFTKGNRIH